ncbi:hypothetical protein [Oceanicoccus sp. KOV_DT_Chl]|uniref:hypothetical protein n=1 Tax=Oceanicoccus sp. KOV_DT_Chl TaxID=1904639 RepID=UPI0011AFB65D|nr:hypothetical protein [Oceanicoccus sp. KOV_DT_Chl]
MPNTTYFILGDLLANGLTGIIVAMCCYGLFDQSWSMFSAMIIAMILGMVLSMILALTIFMRFFGAMEVMLPTMITGMWAGMIVGMRGAMHPLTMMDSILYGLFTGLIVVSLCWAINAKLQGNYPEGSRHD